MMKDPWSAWLDTFDEEGFKDVPVVPLDIYTAASIGNCASISEALEVNVDLLQVCNKGGWTALMYAAYYGHHEAVVLLVSRGAALHSKTPDGRTPLMLAASCGHAETVKGLIKCGSIIEARDNKSWTAIFHAVHSRHCSVLELLLKSGANPLACEPEKGETALQAAIRTSDVDMVSLLLQYGADPTVPDHDGVTPYALASQLRYGNIADAIARAVAMRGIVAGLTPRRTKQDSGEDDSCDKDPGTSLEQLLTDAGLGDYLDLFEQQAVDLLVFLSLTDADLKECGVRKLGPRRKMTALISRWHNGAPLRSAREATYADKLSVELQELQLKNVQLAKDNKALLFNLHQEQELRSSTESLVVEARARLYKCHLCCTEAARQLQCIYDTILRAADYCEHSACRARSESLAPNSTPEWSTDSVLEAGYRSENKRLYSGSQEMTAPIIDAKMTGSQWKELLKPVQNALPGVMVARDLRISSDKECITAEALASSEKVHKTSVSKKIDLNMMADTKEYPWPAHGRASREAYFMDPKSLTSNESRAAVTHNFSNNVDNVSTFTSANNNFKESNVLPKKRSTYSPERARNTNVHTSVRGDAVTTEKAFILDNYRKRPPALCVPRLGGPVKECLELLRSSATMSDPNVPRALTSTSLPGPGHPTSADNQLNPCGSTALENRKNQCSELADKLDGIELGKGSRGFSEQLRMAVEASSTAASSAVYPEAFSSGDSQFTSSNEHNPTVAGVVGGALRGASLAQLFERTSISKTLHDS